MRHKRVVVTHYGGPEVITTIEEDIPTPKPGQIRVKVLAAGVSLPDVLAREGVHPETPRVPYTPGWDLVGEVDQLGRPSPRDLRTGCRTANSRSTTPPNVAKIVGAQMEVDQAVPARDRTPPQRGAAGPTARVLCFNSAAMTWQHMSSGRRRGYGVRSLQRARE